jgi:hypothetical protein
MKKSFLRNSLMLLLGLLLIGSSAIYGQSALPKVWLDTAGTYVNSVAAGNQWFKRATTGNNVRGMAFNTVTKHVLVATRDSAFNCIMILDGNNGDTLGRLNMTGVSGGVYPFNRVAVSADGRIYTTNLQTTATKAAPVKIYTWANESAVPTIAFNDSLLGPRVGDALAVVGTGQETYVYLSGNATPGPVTILKRSGDTLLVRKSFIPTGWGSYGILGIGPTTNGLGSFWLNTSGRAASCYDTSGTPLDTIGTGIVSSGASTSHYFEFGGRKFVAMYSGNTTPSVFRVVDISNGGLNSYVVGVTAELGRNANTNGTGEIFFNAADTTLIGLATNNGVGKFSIPLSVPSVTFNSRIPFIPNAGENDTVYFNLLSMKSISSAQLAYFGNKTSVSDQIGVDSAFATLSQSNGRIYRAVVPASVNRDGRRINFRAEVTDALSKSATVSVAGYFAGITKLGFIGGPRDVDTAGTMLYGGYGIRIKGVCVFEDSIIAAPASRMDIALQDSLGGMDVIDFTVPFPIRAIRGNSYTMEGVMSHYNSRIQLGAPFSGKNIVAIDNGPALLPSPKLVTIRDLAFDRQGEVLENSLIRINNVRLTPGSLAWPGATGAGTNLTITDNGVDSITMRIPAVTKLNGFVPTQTFSVVGVAGQFSATLKKTGYQLIPRDPNDIFLAPVLPLNFEAGNVDYTFTNFSGATATRIANPQKNGIDTSNFVGKMVKGAGDPWAGSFLSMEKPIDFKVTKLFKVKVFMPKVGAKLLLKVENQTNGAFNLEKEATATVANAWQELFYDFSGIDTSKQYQKVVLIFDLGTVGDGSANFTYLFDDVQQYTIPIVPMGATLTTSKIQTTVTNVGHIGGVKDFQDKVGFKFAGSDRLFEGSHIFTTDSTHVSNAWRDRVGNYNLGFRPLKNVKVDTVGSTFRTETRYDDSTQARPLGIAITERTLVDTNAAKAGYLLVQLNVVNTTNAKISKLRVGTLLDFDVTSAGNVDRGGIIRDSTNVITGVNSGNPFKMHVAYEQAGGVNTAFVGLVPLSQGQLSGGRISSGAAEIYPTGVPFSDSIKNNFVSTFRTTNMFTDNGKNDDQSIIASFGPYDINAKDTVRAAFAVISGTSLNELIATARLAQRDYVAIGNSFGPVTKVNPVEVPKTFALEQNFPNPFNPTTMIRFALPNDSKVSLKVFDILGREVRTLLNGDVAAGINTVQWNGRNNAGQMVSTGVYIYRIEAGSNISTKKMMLMK